MKGMAKQYARKVGRLVCQERPDIAYPVFCGAALVATVVSEMLRLHPSFQEL